MTSVFLHGRQAFVVRRCSAAPSSISGVVLPLSFATNAFCNRLTTCLEWPESGRYRQGNGTVQGVRAHVTGPRCAPYCRATLVGVARRRPRGNGCVRKQLDTVNGHPRTLAIPRSRILTDGGIPKRNCPNFGARAASRGTSIFPPLQDGRTQSTD